MSNLSGIDQKLIWHPFSSLSDEVENIIVESGKGVYLNTSDGRRIMDAISSWWVNIHGHSHPYLAKAIADQANKLEHVIFAGFSHPPAIILSERLSRILPFEVDKIFFSDNGSTSVEVALKMAIQYWSNLGTPKKKIIAIDGAYHGDTFGAMSIGERGPFTEPFFPFLFDVSFIDFPTTTNKTNVIKQFKEFIKEKDVAAFIYEPLIQGAAGMRTYSVNTLNELLCLAKQHDIICIADEVMTGFGRTGKLFASEHVETKPDLICISKGITGGTMPLSVTACSEKISSAFKSNERGKTFFHGHSYTANPLACAVANASLDLLLEDQCQQAIRNIEKCHLGFIKKIKDHPAIKQIHHIGTILSIEIASKDDTSYFNDLKKLAYDFFLGKNILLRPLGNIIYILPPYVIKTEELAIIYEAIEEFLQIERLED